MKIFICDNISRNTQYTGLLTQAQTANYPLVQQFHTIQPIHPIQPNSTQYNPILPNSAKFSLIQPNSEKSVLAVLFIADSIRATVQNKLNIKSHLGKSNAFAFIWSQVQQLASVKDGPKNLLLNFG